MLLIGRGWFGRFGGESDGEIPLAEASPTSASFGNYLPVPRVDMRMASTRGEFVMGIFSRIPLCLAAVAVLLHWGPAASAGPAVTDATWSNAGSGTWTDATN